MMAIPSLDFSQYTEGNAAERQQLASQLLGKLSQHGYVKLIGHGISRETVTELLNWVRKNGNFTNKRFFRLPTQEKLAIAHPGVSDPQRGFSCVGSENSSTLYRKGLLKSEVPADLRDAREHFDMGASTDLAYPNRWPSPTHLPRFRTFMERTFNELEKTSALIMSALETALNLQPGTFLSSITHAANASEMRLNHYPAIPVREIKSGTVNRIWPHFDLGVITLLFQDGNCSGLEFEDRSHPGGKHFNRVESRDPVEMVVNVSETLQRWTNGRLAAGLHRVNMPQGMDDCNDDDAAVVPERYSVAYFCKADRQADVGAMREFVEPDEKARYEHISAIEYHQQRLQSAY